MQRVIREVKKEVFIMSLAIPWEQHLLALRPSTELMVGGHMLQPPDEGKGWVGEPRISSGLRYDSDIPSLCALTSFRGQLSLLVSPVTMGGNRSTLLYSQGAIWSLNPSALLLISFPKELLSLIFIFTLQIQDSGDFLDALKA